MMISNADGGNDTASNGNPHQQDSLHYIDPHGRPNAYQRVSIRSSIMYNLSNFFGLPRHEGHNIADVRSTLRRRSKRLVTFSSSMIQIRSFLLGVLGAGQSTSQFLTASH